MTYRQLLHVLTELPQEQLDNDVTVFDGTDMEYYAVSDFGVASDDGVLDYPHCVLSIK